jgi:diguanylate cyclase (GGDEF)-like protein
MFNYFSIRKKIIISVLLSCLIPYTFGGFYIKTLLEDWLHDNYIEHSNMILESTAKTIDDSILELMANLTKMMSNDNRVLNATTGIRTYTDDYSLALASEKSSVEQDLEAYLSTIKESQDFVTLVAFGNESGGYVEVPAFKPKKAYDPRTRPWYQETLATNGAYFTEPYQTQVSNDLVFAVAHAVYDQNEPIGVVSLTIKLDTLLEEINTQSDDSNAYFVILSPNNRFINSPKNRDWLLKSTDEIPNNLFNQLSQYNGHYFEDIINEEASIFSVYISPYSGWQFVSVVKKSDVLEASTVLSRIFFLIYTLTLLIIVLLVYWIARYITKPILSLAQVIHEMAAFRFDLYRNKRFETYSHLNDEIGEIARALNHMQDNYVELDHTLTTMNEAIQSIDIHSHAQYQLQLSEGNPFAFMMGSINTLLKRVYGYIDQIKHINQELTTSNELLASSEEELMAQLEEIESQKEIIRLLAEHDPLTDLPNRRLFQEHLSTILEQGGTGAVIMLDLDNFKGINDTLGHVFGDLVLQYVAQKLNETASSHTFISRFGGDEFLILLEYHHMLNDITSYINTLQEAFNQRVVINQHEVMIEFSIGISCFPEDSSDINQLVMNADLALYHIKNTGKNNYAFFNLTMFEELNAKRIIKDVLRDAIENDGFKMVYQPLIDLKTGYIVGYEALLRLKNNRFNPGDFIPVAEEDNMIFIIGRLVTEMTIKQMKLWASKGYVPRTVSINFSAVQIHDYSYKDFLLECLTIHRINPKHITIEITENIFLENRTSTIAFLNELRKHGIRIAVDDFGTGYSSLSYLSDLPIDCIKLDRSMGTKFLELKNIAVMDSLIALGHSLNLTVIAEGIESYEQVRRLSVGKCDIVQGYYFSRPLEVDAVEENYDAIYKVP